MTSGIMSTRWESHRLLPCLAIIVTIAFGSVPVRAAEPPTTELLEVFTAACLTKFPDDTEIRKYARESQFGVMADERLHRLLGSDPGEGWVQKGDFRQYLLTLELPPYHTCAIRTVGTNPDLVPAFAELIGSWATAETEVKLNGPSKQTAMISGIPHDVYVWKLDRGPGKAGETMMAIVPSQLDANEVRLVRGINR